MQNYLFNSVIQEPWLTQYGLVVANWAPLAPYVPAPWAPMAWDAWQYTASAPGKYYGFPAAIRRKASPEHLFSPFGMARCRVVIDFGGSMSGDLCIFSVVLVIVLGGVLFVVGSS